MVKNVVSAIRALTNSFPIYEYIRLKNGRRVGVLLAIDKNTVGWALCHKHEKFNSTAGLMLAFSRISERTTEGIPNSIKGSMEAFFNRMDAYYVEDKPRKSKFWGESIPNEDRMERGLSKEDLDEGFTDDFTQIASR